MLNDQSVQFAQHGIHSIQDPLSEMIKEEQATVLCVLAASKCHTNGNMVASRISCLDKEFGKVSWSTTTQGKVNDDCQGIAQAKFSMFHCSENTTANLTERLKTNSGQQPWKQTSTCTLQARRIVQHWEQMTQKECVVTASQNKQPSFLAAEWARPDVQTANCIHTCQNAKVR